MVGGRAWLQDEGSPIGRPSTLRAAFALVAFILLVAGLHAQDETNLEAFVTGRMPWGGWLTWIVLLALAGLAFGLAARVPFVLRFHAGRAALLAVIPSLCVLEVSVSFGPTGLVTFVAQHARFLWLDVSSADVLMEIGNLAAVLLGVAVAAGFVSDEPPPRRRRLSLLLL
jgi:hypothetical protein